MTTTTRSKTKNPKGLVNIESVKDRLRLRWRYGGKQYCLATGYPDTPECRAAAQIQANKIWLDIVGGYFDETLNKYRQQPYPKNTPTLLDLISKFIDHKSNYQSERSVEKYATLQRRLEKIGLQRLKAHELDREVVARIYTSLREKSLSSKTLSINTTKNDLWLLNAVLKWNGIECVSLQEAIQEIKVPPKQSAKPFTKDEVQRILEAFEKLFPHFQPYVTFLLNTGCRTAEAAGLRWRHVADDCSSLWIGRSLRRGVEGTTKTHKARVVPCNSTVREMLLNLKSTQPASPNDLVFTSLRGCGIFDSKFAKDYWKPALAAAGVKYRKPYTTRSTFISHSLESGLSPATVASISGHNIQTMYESYAASVTCLPQVPELY